MNCSNCGAPLPPTSNICRYCKTLNDVDLRAIPRRATEAETSQRICPRCAQNLVTINIGGSKPLAIDRCPECLGLFFDNGELETVLDDNIAKVHEIDYQRIRELNENEHQISDHDTTVRYVKCPVCRTVMNRKVFGTRSGVVVDRCRAHGIWLDAGELGQLLRWMKAGGKLYDTKRKRDEQRAKEVSRRAQRRINQNAPTHIGGDRWLMDDGTTLDGAGLTGVMHVLSRLLW